MPKVTEIYQGVSNDNKQTILKFCKDMELLDLSEQTIYNYKFNLIKLGRFLKGITYKRATKDEIKSFFVFLKETKYSSGSQETMKIVLKRFYKWLFELEQDDKLPDCVRWIKFKTNRQKKRETDILKEMTVSDYEYKKLIETASGNIQSQAIVETLYWFGVRISELTSMNIDGVKRKDGIIEITVLNSKTQPRPVKLSESEYYPKHLMNWLDNHPFRGQPGKPVWLNFTKRKKVYKERIKDQPIRDILTALAKESKLKHIHPHMFRHTAITKDLANGMPVAHVATKYSVSLETIQSTYNHSGEKEFTEWLQKKSQNYKAPTFNEIKKEKERLETEFEQRVSRLEKQFEERLKILDSGLAKATRKHMPDYPAQRIIEDYQRLKQGMEMMLNKMISQGRSQADIKEFRNLMSQGLQ